MRVVALERFEYANKLRLPGDAFDTDNDEDARLLELVGRVTKVIFPDPPITEFVAVVAVEGRDLRSEVLTGDANPVRKPNPYRDKYRNRYRHRAMRAEE